MILSKLLLWSLVAGSLGGQVLITKHKRIGFLLWVVVDIGWALFWFAQYKVPGAIEQALLWVLYVAVSGWGWLVYKEPNEKVK